MRKKLFLISFFIIIFVLCIPNIVFADFEEGDASDELDNKEGWVAWLNGDSSLETLKENKKMKTSKERKENNLEVKTNKKFKVTKNKELVFHAYFEAIGLCGESEKWTGLEKVEKEDKKGNFKEIEKKEKKYKYAAKAGFPKFANGGINSVEHRYSLTFFESGKYKCYMKMGDNDDKSNKLYYMITVTVDKSEEELFAEELKTAYQGSVPDTNDGAEEIIKFVISDAEYNTGTKKIDEVELDKLKAWKVIVEEFDEESSPAWGYRETVLKYLDADIAEREGVISQEEADKLKEDALEAAKRYLLAITSTVDPGQDRTPTTFYDVLENVEDYIPGVDLSNDEEAEEMLSVALSVITNIGMVLSILVPAILGVKYMMGSVEEKAEYKESLMPYFIGSVLLFGICTVVKILQEVGLFINS